MIERFEGKSPAIDEDTFVHSSSTVIGDVTICARVSVWPGAVIRADVSSATIGELTNIQDNACIHVDSNCPTVLGKGVTVGHGAMLHACTVEDFSLIGIGAVVLDKAVIGHHSIIAAGTLIPPGKVVPPKSKVMGSPGKIVSELTDEEARNLEHHAGNYWKLAERFINGGADGKEP